MAPKSRDGWKHMPPDQPRTCQCGQKIRLKNFTAWFKTMEPTATSCSRCVNTTLLLSYCGCAYCATALAAVEDAHEAHRTAA